MYYEKIYLFLWLWTFALVIVTVLSIARWVWLLVPWRRRSYVHGLLRDGRLNWFAAGREPDSMKVLDDAHVGDVNKYLGVCLRIDLKLYPARKKNASLIAEMGHTFLFTHSQIDGAFMFYLIEFNANRIVAVNVLHEICETLRKSVGPRPRAPENSPSEQPIYRRPVGPSERDNVFAVVSRP